MLWKDLELALRRLRYRPVSTAAIVLVLALGIGPMTAIFSVIHAFLFSAPPVGEPDTLVAAFLSDKSGSPYGRFSLPEVQRLDEQDDVLAGVAGFAPFSVSFGHEEQGERVEASVVTPDYFSVLGVDLVAGRGFGGSGGESPDAPVAVISDRLRERFFGGSDALGAQISLGGEPFTVTGVAPAGFHGVSAGFIPELWVPIGSGARLADRQDALSDRGDRWLGVIARLAPGVSQDRAEAAVGTLASSLEHTYPETNEGRNITLLPLRKATVWPTARQLVGRLMTLVQLVAATILLMACLNVANLLLARGSERWKEIAVRLSLGASRRRLVTQVLTESMVLALLGGVLGVALAFVLVRALSAAGPRIMQVFTIDTVDLGLNLPVLGFALTVTLLTGILFGLIPALQSTKPELVAGLKGEEPLGGQHKTRLKDAFIVLQLAFSMLLLNTTGLFLDGLLELERVETGFDQERIMTATVDISRQIVEEERGRRILERVERRVERFPGVESASYSLWVPVEQESSRRALLPVGRGAGAREGVVEYHFNVVGEGYFETLGISLLQGRGFRREDAEREEGVVVVNREMAERFWPGERAVGRRLTIAGSPDSAFEVVGVVETTKYLQLGEAPRPYAYFPFSRSFEPQMSLLVRAEGDPKRLEEPVRQAFWQVAPEMPVFDVETLEEHLADARRTVRLTSVVLAAFTLLALVLASIGIYGVLSYLVARRSQEIGVRMALGATRRDILKLVLARVLVLALIGVGLGLVLSFLLGGLLAARMAMVESADVLASAIAAALLVTVAILASVIPARRAANMPPRQTLRQE